MNHDQVSVQSLVPRKNAEPGHVFTDDESPGKSHVATRFAMAEAANPLGCWPSTCVERADVAYTAAAREPFQPSLIEAIRARSAVPQGR